MLRRQGVLLLVVVLFLVAFPDCSCRSAAWTCISNCAQCKRIYGHFFEGQRCADSCLKYKGLLMPDCNDISTISSFLNKLE